jgi:uncharacterized protein (DUF58 family)
MRRSLYHFYRLMAAAKFLLGRRILPGGLGMGIASVVVATMLMGSPVKPLFQMFALLFGLSVVALVWSWMRRARLQAERELPSHAAAGQTLRYAVVLHNLGGNLRHWQLQETPADPRPSWPLFSQTREPGEAYRNAFDRYFAFNRWQWLIDKARLFDGGESQPAPACDAGATCRLTMSLTPARRGCIVLDDMRVLLPDPFRFFQRARKVKALPSMLSVLPRRYRLPPFHLPGSAHYHAGDDATSRQSGSSGEFTSLREYRTSDPPRMIHWKSWAKLGRPIIKEVEDVVFPRYALVLDTFAAGHEWEFEEAVSVAASLVAEIDTEEVMLDLMFLGHEEHVITAGRGLADSRKLLEALAAVSVAGGENFTSLTRLIARHGGDLSACICVFTGWSPERAEFLAALDAMGLATVSMAVRTDDQDIPARVHPLRALHMQEDLMRWQP